MDLSDLTVSPKIASDRAFWPFRAPGLCLRGPQVAKNENQAKQKIIPLEILLVMPET